MWAAQKRIAVAITVLQIMSWVIAASRPLPLEAQGQSPQSMQVEFEGKQRLNGKEIGGSEGKVNEEAMTGLGTLGSRPPSCDHKCGGCTPCEPMQVPTTTDHLNLHYSNYEPEGWKCKCGATFFNP